MRLINSCLIAATIACGNICPGTAGASSLPEIDCALKTESIALVKRTVVMPTSGPIVVESHLATAEDRFPMNRLFPKSSEERLGLHLVRSCQILLKIRPDAKCVDVYSDPNVQVWTPAEGGAQGQGSEGNLKPPSSEELWSGNMYWTAKSKPAPGTRYLVSRGEKHLVVAMGYETGPVDVTLLLGLQSEAAYYLDAKNDDSVNVGRLVDQAVLPGPALCRQSTR